MKNILVTIVILVNLISCVVSVVSITKQINQQEKQNRKLELMQKALEMSDNLLDSHNIWDTDGSDYMSDYLTIRQEIDSTFLSGFDK